MATQEERIVVLIEIISCRSLRPRERPEAGSDQHSQMMWEMGSFRFALLSTASSPNPIREGSPNYSAALAERERS